MNFCRQITAFNSLATRTFSNSTHVQQQPVNGKFIHNGANITNGIHDDEYENGSARYSKLDVGGASFCSQNNTTPQQHSTNGFDFAKSNGEDTTHLFATEVIKNKTLQEIRQQIKSAQQPKNEDPYEPYWSSSAIQKANPWPSLSDSAIKDEFYRQRPSFGDWR